MYFYNSLLPTFSIRIGPNIVPYVPIAKDMSRSSMITRKDLIRLRDGEDMQRFYLICLTTKDTSRSPNEVENSGHISFNKAWLTI